MRIARPAHRPRLLVGAMLALLVVPLAACAAPVPSAQPSAQPATQPAPSPSETTAPALALAPELSADANLAYFDSIARVVAATNPPDGRAYVDALVAGGFDKAAMQLSFDRTHVNLEADSVEFSVEFNEECLIGQYGPASGGYHSTVAHVLGSGTCLLGVTRQIDW